MDYRVCALPAYCLADFVVLPRCWVTSLRRLAGQTSTDDALTTPTPLNAIVNVPYCRRVSYQASSDVVCVDYVFWLRVRRDVHVCGSTTRVVSCPYVLRQLDPKSWLGVQIGVLVPRDSDPNTEARDPSRTSGIFRPSGGG